MKRGAVRRVEQMSWELRPIVVMALAARPRRSLVHFFSKWEVVVMVVGQDLPEVGTELSGRDRWFGGKVEEFCNGFVGGGGVIVVLIS